MAAIKTIAAVTVAILLSFLAGSLIPLGKTVEVTKTVTITSASALTEVSVETVERTVTETTQVERTVTFTTSPERPKAPPLGLELEYAKLFKVVFNNGYKVVVDALNRTLVLVPRGSAPPEGFEGIVVETPVDSVVLLSSTHVALLHRLKEFNPDIINSIGGIAWGGSYEWYLPDIKQALESGRIKDIGAAWSPNYEEILTINPNVMFIYTYPGDRLPGKLDELGITYAVDNEWLENSALGRFEWIKFIATFYDMDYEAWVLFNRVKENVSDVISRVKNAEGPVVAWFSIYKGTAYVSGGRSYVANALQELGADYIFKDTRETGSVAVTLEELVSRVVDADVIIYPSDLVESVDDILSEVPELAEAKAFKEGRVYAFSPAYWQLGLAYPEDWYRDLAAILYPNLFPQHELRLFKPLIAGAVS